MRRALQPVAWIAAILLLTGTLGAASYRHRVAFDASFAGRNTLSPASAELIERLPGALSFTSYLPGNSPLREGVRLLVERYRRVKPDIGLRFVDPAAAPPAPGLGQGDLIARWNEREERVSRLDEAGVSNALARLLRGSQRWVAVLSGHGERSTSRGANHDLSEFGKLLAERGLQLRELTLTQTLAVPANAAVAILASPRVPYLAAEVQAIIDYLAQGGALLWLTEPGENAGLQALQDYLGVAPVPGFVVDPTSLRYRLQNASFTVVTRYIDHALVAGFDRGLLLPEAAALHVRAVNGWQPSPLFETDRGAWSETAPEAGQASFDERSDFAGPLRLGYALERPADGGPPQRAVVIGDGDFLSNQYLGNVGNGDFGIRLIEWLARDDALVEVRVPRAPDRELQFSRWQIAVFGFGFLIVLPVLLLGNGLLVWRRRNRA